MCPCVGASCCCCTALALCLCSDWFLLSTSLLNLHDVYNERVGQSLALWAMALTVLALPV